MVRLPSQLLSAALAGASLLCGCGMLGDADAPDGAGDRDGAGDNEDDASDGGQPVCQAGQLRLSDEACAAGRRVETCEAGSWVRGESCRGPDDCEDGTSTPAEGFCGSRALNQRVTICSGELLQEGCLCGSPDPYDWGDETFIESWGDIQALAGITYIDNLEVEAGPFEPGPLVMPGLLCVNAVNAVSPAAFPDLVVAGSMGVGSAAPTCARLETIERLVLLGSAPNLDGISSVVRLGRISVANDELVHLVGLPQLQQLDSVDIEASALQSVEMLAPIETLSSNLLIRSEAHLDLSGLRQLASVGGDVELTISDEAALQDLGALQEIGGNVTIHLPDKSLFCQVGEAFGQKSIGGITRIDGRPFSPEDCP